MPNLTYTTKTKITIPAEITLIRGNYNKTISMRRYFQSKGYKKLADIIEADQKDLPSQGDNISLYLTALNNEKDNSLSLVRETGENSFFRSFTVVYNFPDNLRFYQDIDNWLDILEPNQEILEEKLGSNEQKKVVFSDDGKLRRVQSNICDEIEKKYFALVPDLIGISGSEENADAAAEIAGKFKNNPYLFLLNDVANPTITFSALLSYLYDQRLCVDGDVHGNYWGGYAFGVQRKTGEASCAEK